MSKTEIPDMKKYIVTAIQTHEIEIDAESPEDAEEKFNAGEGDPVQQFGDLADIQSIVEVE